MEIQMDALTGMPQQRGYLDLVDDCLGKLLYANNGYRAL